MSDRVHYFRCFAFTVFACAVLAACADEQKGTAEVAAPYPVLLFQQAVGERRFQYAEVPGNGGTPLLFIHGSPGDWQAWSYYLHNPDLDDFGVRRAIDRPGFGGSTTGGIMTDLREQANLFATLLEGQRPSIIVSHSLGGPIAAWLAIDHPDVVCGVVSIAGSLDPELEGLRWYNEIASWRIFHPLIPTSLVDSNREMESLQPQLRLLDQAWSQLRTPFMALQGMQDELVNPATADYLETTVDKSLISVQRLPNQNHFVLWESPKLVTDAIVKVDRDDCQSHAINTDL